MPDDRSTLPTGRNPWTTRSTDLRYENPWIRVFHHDVLTPHGTPGIYGVVRFRNLAIGIVPVAADGTTWLVGQWRYPHGRYSWEIPEGGGALDVPPEESARRELAEETGLRAVHLVELLRMDLSNAVTDETAIAYAAWDLTEGEAAPEETEDLRVQRVPLGQAVAMAMAGDITDSISVASLLKLHMLSAQGALPDGLAQAVALGLK